MISLGAKPCVWLLLNSVGLKKLCSSLKIPTPPRGYWAKLKNGKKVRQPQLPVWTEDSDPSYGVTYYSDHIKADRERQEAEKVEVPASDIVVAEELVAADP